MDQAGLSVVTGDLSLLGQGQDTGAKGADWGRLVRLNPPTGVGEVGSSFRKDVMLRIPRGMQHC